MMSIDSTHDLRILWCHPASKGLLHKEHTFSVTVAQLMISKISCVAQHALHTGTRWNYDHPMLDHPMSTCARSFSLDSATLFPYHLISVQLRGAICARCIVFREFAMHSRSRFWSFLVCGKSRTFHRVTASVDSIPPRFWTTACYHAPHVDSGDVVS